MTGLKQEKSMARAVPKPANPRKGESGMKTQHRFKQWALGLAAFSMAWIMGVSSAAGQCVLIAFDNNSVAIDTAPNVCVHVKSLDFTLTEISDIRIDWDLGHSHGCCHHTSLDFRLNLDGVELFREELPFVRGAPSGCENTQV